MERDVGFELKLALNALLAADAVAEQDGNFALTDRLKPIWNVLFDLVDLQGEKDVVWFMDTIDEVKREYSKEQK